MGATPFTTRWVMPYCAFGLGGALVLALGFGVGRALQPTKPEPVERWLTSRAPQPSLIPWSTDTDPGISPGSVRGMIEYMRRSEIEIATERLALEREDW